METRQMTPIFLSTFSTVTVCTLISEFENSQNSFSCSPPFGPFLSVKYLNLGLELPIWTDHHIFIEIRQPEVTENLYYVSHGLTILSNYDLWILIIMQIFSNIEKIRRCLFQTKYFCIA